MKKVYCIAGEASGDLLGSRIMQALLRRSRVQFRGVGGSLITPRLESRRSLFPMEEINVMGLSDVLKNIRRIRGALQLTVEDIRRHKPDVLITIDSKGFNFRVLQRLSEELPDMKRVHVVSPSFWAFKHRSVERQLQPLKDAKVDLTLLLLPFEKQAYDAYALPSAFIGYPAVEELLDYRGYVEECKAESIDELVSVPRHLPDTHVDSNDRSMHALSALANLQPTQAERQSQKDAKGITNKVIILCPGSRQSEILKHMPILAEGMGVGYDYILPVTQASYACVRSYLERHIEKGYSVSVGSCPEFKKHAFIMGDAAVACSGTVVSELAYFGVPTVVIYKGDKLTECVVKAIAAQKYVSIPNILANLDYPVIPEVLFGDASSSNVIDALIEQLRVGRHQQDKITSVLAQMSLWDSAYTIPARPSEVAAMHVLSVLS